MSYKIAFITGITGFVGSHLADYLLNIGWANYEIYGLARWRSPLDNIKHLLSNPRLHILHGDLNDPQSLHSALSSIEQPDSVFHLAAQSYVPYSQIAPLATMQTNIIGTLNLFDALLWRFPSVRVHVCSSSEVYGNPEITPIGESAPLHPVSPYSVSKAAMDLLAYQYYENYAFKTIRTRAFTHTGPRRGDVFVASAFAKQIAMAEKNHPDGATIRVGNLDSVRTWCDVRDMVDAYYLALRHGTPGEVYNVGGSETCTVGKMLDMLLAKSELTNVEIKHDSNLFRPTDVTLQIPDISKFQRETGWAPRYALSDTLQDLLDYHRRKAQ